LELFGPGDQQPFLAQLLLLANWFVIARLVIRDHHSMAEKSKDIQEGLLVGWLLYVF
jgi:hypothetical protein